MIVKTLEIEHPAAKMLGLAASMQDDECGDVMNLMVRFAGKLLEEMEHLLPVKSTCIFDIIFVLDSSNNKKYTQNDIGHRKR